MNIRMKSKPPELNVFIQYLGLGLLTAIAIGIPIALFTEDLPVSTILIILFSPIAFAAAMAYSARKFSLLVDNVSQMDELNSYVMDYLVSEDLMTVSEDAGGIWMESTKPWNKWMNHWFGTERVRVVRTPGYIQVFGHRRYIDGLDSKLRYGRKK